LLLVARGVPDATRLFSYLLARALAPGQCNASL
jgi:hypothetical protein